MAEGAARLLFADDNKVNRLLLSRSLEQLGHRVAMAENGGGFIGLGEAAMCVHILEKV